MDISSEINKDTVTNLQYAPDTKQIVAFLISIQFIGFFFYGGFRIIFPLILKKYGYSSEIITTDWAIIFTIALFVGGFGTRIIMGIVSDVLPRKQGLLLGTSISIISIFLIPFTKNIILLGILFALLRTGTHIFPLTTRSYANETKPANQNKLNGFVLIGTNAASFLGPIILGYFLEVSLQVLIAFSCLILILVSIVLNFQTPKKLKRQKVPARDIFTRSLSELSEIWKIIIIFVVIGLINGIYGTILVPFALYALQLSDLFTTLVVGIIQLTSIIFILISGRVNHRYGLFNLIYFGLLFILAGSSIIFFGKISLITFVIGSMLISGGLQININSLVTVVTLTASKETSATAFGTASGCFFLGASFIPLIVAELFNINFFYPYLVIMLICLIVVFPIYKVKLEYQKNSIFKS